MMAPSRDIRAPSRGRRPIARRLAGQGWFQPRLRGDWLVRGDSVGWPRKRSANRRAKLSEHSSDDRGLRERLSAAGEEAFEEVTQALLDNPLLNQALASALGAGERALAAQKSAMSALNIPSADDFERLERRLRSISNRLDDLEDRLDEMSDDVVALRGHRSGASQDR